MAVPCFGLRAVACQNIRKASLFRFRQYNKWQSVHVWKAQRKLKWLHLLVQKSFQRQMIENSDIPKTTTFGCRSGVTVVLLWKKK